MGARGSAHIGTPRLIAGELGELANECVGVAGRDHHATLARAERFAHAEGIPRNDGQAMGLRFTEEIRQRLAQTGVDSQIGCLVVGTRVRLMAGETHAAAHAEAGGECLAGGAFRTIADEPEQPRKVARQLGGCLDQDALVLLRSEDADVEQDDIARLHPKGLAGGFAGPRGLYPWSEYKRVVNHLQLCCRTKTGGLKARSGFAAVAHDGTGQSKASTKEPRQRFSGPHRRHHRNRGQPALEPACVAVGHAPHREHEVGGERAHPPNEAGRKPVEPGIKGLERLHGRQGGALGENAAGAKRQDTGVVTAFAEGCGEEERLAFGAAAAEVVLEDQDFHCRHARVAATVRVSQMRSLPSLLLRWLVLALGVTIATKVVPGIQCDDLATLVVVVLVLSFFNAILRPLLVLLTLPFILLTMGLGMVVINALLFLAAGHLVKGFTVAGFWPAVGAAIVVGLTNLILGGIAKPPAPKPPQRRPEEKRADVIDI